jgi:hypothetical protein
MVHSWRSGGSRTAGPQIFKKIEDGIREFEDARPSAVKTLEAAIVLACANPIAWANEPKYRDQVRRGLLFYALARDFRAKDERDQASRTRGKAQAEYTNKGLADEAARGEALAEMLRSFPGFVVKADEHGARAEALFSEAAKRSQQLGRGSLELDIDDPNLVVYVNEVIQPRKTTIGDLVAGTYRVLVVSATESHEYPVDVLATKRSRLVVNWDLDSVLKLDGWTGFAYRSEAERQRERELLAALIGPSNVDVAASLTVTSEGRWSVVAGTYDMRKGTSVTTCTLERSSRLDPEAIERFARCLAREPDDRPTNGPITSRTALPGQDRGKGAGATAATTTTHASAPARIGASRSDEEVGEVDKADVDVGVVVTGDASLQPQIAAHIEEWLRGHGHRVVAAPLPPDAISTMIDCFIIDGGGDGCARGVVDHRARASAVVFAKADVAPTGDGMRDIKLTAYWFQKRKESTARQRTCERCTEDRLRAETDALMTELAKSREQGRGLLRVTSSPSGAKVIVDDEPVGVTPVDYYLPPGNHQVTLMLDRHQTEQRSVAILVDDTTPLNVPMTPTPDRPGEHPLRRLGVGVGGLGLAALGTGIALLVIDEDDGPARPYYRNTAPAGFVVTAAGGVALGLGAWLLLHDKSASGAIASASRDGGYVGWFTRF